MTDCWSQLWFISGCIFSQECNPSRRTHAVPLGNSDKPHYGMVSRNASWWKSPPCLYRHSASTQEHPPHIHKPVSPGQHWPAAGCLATPPLSLPPSTTPVLCEGLLGFSPHQGSSLWAGWLDFTAGRRGDSGYPTHNTYPCCFRIFLGLPNPKHTTHFLEARLKIFTPPLKVLNNTWCQIRGCQPCRGGTNSLTLLFRASWGLGGVGISECSWEGPELKIKTPPHSLLTRNSSQQIFF